MYFLKYVKRVFYCILFTDPPVFSIIGKEASDCFDYWVNTAPAQVMDRPRPRLRSPLPPVLGFRALASFILFLEGSEGVKYSKPKSRF